MTKDEALRLALEALERYVNEDEVIEGMRGNEPWVETKRIGEKAITAIKAALEAKDEPVAWMDASRFEELHNGFTVMTTLTKKKAFFDDVAIYTTPPQRTWVGLTDNEFEDLVEDEDWFNDPVNFAKIIQNKLKEKNT